MLADILKTQMDELLSRVQQIKCGVNVNQNIRFLARNLAVPEMFLLEGMMDSLNEEENVKRLDMWFFKIFLSNIIKFLFWL